MRPPPAPACTYRRVFRALVLGDFGLSLASGLVDDLQTGVFVPAVAVDGLPSPWWWFLAAGFVLGGILSLVTLIALLRFHPLGRTLFVALTIAGGVLPLLLVPALRLPPPPPVSLLEDLLSSLSIMARGATLAMAYTEPIRSRFERA